MTIAADPTSEALGAAVGDAYRGFCAAFAALLGAVADHDRTEADRGVGLRSEEDWLRRVLELDWRTSRDWVRQARLVAAQPELGARLAAGGLSVDKLRSMADYVATASPDTVRPKGPFDGEGPGP